MNNVNGSSLNKSAQMPLSSGVSSGVNTQNISTIPGVKPNVVMLDDGMKPVGLENTGVMANTVAIAKPNLAPPVNKQDAFTNATNIQTQLNTIDQGEVNLGAALTNAMVAMSKSALDEKREAFKQIQADRLSMAGSFELQKQMIMNGATAQLGASMTQGTEDLASGVVAAVLLPVTIALAIVTGGATAAAEEGATQAAEAAAQNAAKAATNEGTQGAAQQGAQASAKNTGDHLLSDRQVTSASKNIMKTLKNIYQRGDSRALRDNLTESFQNPLKEKMKSTIKDALPKNVRSRIDADEAKTQARKEARAQRETHGKLDKVKNFFKDQAEDLTTIDTNEILDSICNHATHKLFHMDEELLNEAKKKTNESLQTDAQIQQKIADTVGRAADTARDSLQTTMDSADQAFQNYNDVKDMLQQIIDTQSQTTKTITGAI